LDETSYARVEFLWDSKRTLRQERRHLGDTPRVAAPGERRLQKGRQTVARDLWPDQARAEGENVGVVVLAPDPPR
jgi:hypothetical protein